MKRGTSAHKKRERLLKYTKGFRWDRKTKERAAREALLHAWSRSFKGRKEKKRDYRALWNVQINAGVRAHGTKYSAFMHALKEKKIGLNRKILANLAQNEPEAFQKIVEAIRT